MKPVPNTQKTTDFLEIIQSELVKGINHSNADFFARHLGAHVDGNSARFLIWHPAIESEKEIRIEIFLALGNLIFDKPEQHFNVAYYSFPIKKAGPFGSIVLDNIPAGNREQFGAFYQYKIIENDNKERIIRDPMAWSLPYGIHAPAELYDVEKVLEDRNDKEYFRNIGRQMEKTETNRIGPSTNILEVHTGTATLDGSLHSLTQRYRQIAVAIKSGDAPTPDEKNLLGFDSIELMPVNPVLEHPEKHNFWNTIQTPGENGSEITIRLRKPTVTNWGYDTVIFGSAALNPSILSTGRPHELLELIETLHNFPNRPVKVILDVVYGHADSQAKKVLPEEFFAGKNMYGLNLDFRNPLVRAMILEMHRRKINWGFDGARVDGAQDFKYYDAEQDVMLYDDEFLKQMSEIEQEVAGITYKPWMIFEDGRPWPRNDWELASTYREITKQQKHPFQWAPMIFSYNTPYKYTYWVSKWWRVRELLTFGDKWISGYANHDTIRRGSQANPKKINVNFLLGNSLKMVLDNAYNNPSTTLLMNGFLPGVPMDFVQALGNTPWSFIRNTDTVHAAKIVAEEAFFTEWQITEIEYRNSRYFNRLKEIGFKNLLELRRFAKALLNFVQATDYNTKNIADLLNHVDPPFQAGNWNSEKLNEYAFAWMEDLNEYCNADLHADYIDSKKAEFNLKTREFRLKNPWLTNNFTEKDLLSYREPVNGAVIFYGYRKDQNSGKELIFISNMEGQPRLVSPADLNLPIQNPEEWNVALSTPSVRAKKINHPIKLSISQGILFEKLSKKI